MPHGNPFVNCSTALLVKYILFIACSSLSELVSAITKLRMYLDFSTSRQVAALGH